LDEEGGIRGVLGRQEGPEANSKGTKSKVGGTQCNRRLNTMQTRRENQSLAKDKGNLQKLILLPNRSVPHPTIGYNKMGIKRITEAYSAAFISSIAEFSVANRCLMIVLLNWTKGIHTMPARKLTRRYHQKRGGMV